MVESYRMCSRCMVFFWHGCLLPAVAFLYRSGLRCGHRRTDIARRPSTAATSSSPVSGIPEKHKSTEIETETLVMLCRMNGFLFSGSGESHLR